MENFLYRIGQITLLLCPTPCMPNQGVLEYIKEGTRADFLCLMMPSLSQDASLSLYGEGRLLTPAYEAILASAYHLCITRGLPIYEYSFLCNKSVYRAFVEKTINVSMINLSKCKPSLSKNDVKSGEYALYSSQIADASTCLCLRVENASVFEPGENPPLPSLLDGTVKPDLIVWSKGDKTNVRFFPFGSGELSPTLAARLFCICDGEARDRMDLCEDSYCRQTGSRIELYAKPKLVRTFEFDLLP